MFSLIKKTFLLLVIVLVALNAGIKFGFMPDNKVMSGDELSSLAIKGLQEKGLVKRDEVIDYFYSDAFFSFTRDGNILTNKRLIVYASDKVNGLQVIDVYFKKITKLDLVAAQSVLENSVINVFTKDGDELSVYLSAEQGGDQVFYQALQKAIKHRA